MLYTVYLSCESVNLTNQWTVTKYKKDQKGWYLGGVVSTQNVLLGIWGLLKYFDLRGIPGGGFKYFWFSPLLGEMIQFDE